MTAPGLRPMNLQLFAGERTEPATPRRREEARRRGQVFRSVELNAALAFLAVFGLLHFLGPSVARGIAAWSQTLLMERPRDWSGGDVAAMATGAVLAWARAAGPILVLAALVPVGVSLLQTGPVFSTATLVPDFGQLSPARGLRRVLSVRAAVELAKALVKTAVVGAVALITVRQAAGEFPALVDMEPAATAAVVVGWVDRLAWRVGAAFLALAAADYFYQRWEHERSLRMSREEIKHELKETEGDPRIRALRRSRQRELARRRMLQDVARAHVVVANPDHYAVALRYDPAEMAAPVVVAKGKGYLAQRIKEAAHRHGVMVVEQPPLARALYRMVKVGQAIPEELYQAVAEVLAFVWRIKGYRGPAAG